MFSLRRYWFYFLITAAITVSYYLLATRGTTQIPHDLDYFNPLARSFLQGKTDLPSPVVTYDLSSFGGKWYPYWGPLPALLLIPAQLLLRRFIPTLYLSLFCLGASAIVVWELLGRLPAIFNIEPLSRLTKVMFFSLLYFGTSLVFVGTHSGVWYVSQAVSFLPQVIALSILLKNRLTPRDYLLASLCISLEFLGRHTTILTGSLLVLRLADDWFFNHESLLVLKRKILFALVPFLCFLGLFCLYNLARFGSPLETGFRFQDQSRWDLITRAPFGLLSWHYIPRNLWLIFFELPRVTLGPAGIKLIFNHEAMSIFFVTPFLLTIFLTLRKEKERWAKLPYRLVVYLWASFVLLLIPSLLLFSPGLYQFGLRYSVDFILILLILGIVGLRGKLSFLAVLSIIAAVAINLYSLFILP